jgi:GNAT superfamily N-acetyltransferase
MTFRDSNTEDYAAIARLMHYTHSFPADEEKLIELEENRVKESPYLRQVAVVDGQVVGYSKSQRWEIPQPIRYILAVAVDPAKRKIGIGKQLYDIAENHAKESGAEQLWIQFVEGDEIGKGFAERRGYSPAFYLQDLTLDVKTFDFTPFKGIVEEVQSGGIRFVPFSLLGETTENRRKLYELNVAVERDVPHFGQDVFMSYEDWQRKHLRAKWFDSAGQCVALDGDKWVGLGAVGEFYPGTHVNAITGVLREYRGRRIGLALKLIGIEFARSRCAKELRTQNHGTNAPMLAINKRLGYQGLPGWFTYEKWLSTQR